MQSSGTTPIIRYVSVPSTNIIAYDLALQGHAHGTVILAQQQEHGRGRGEKSFASPPGGLYMSVILRPCLPPEKLPFIPLAAGVACARVIEDQTGLDIMLKWPNDLYLFGKKLGGILAESGPYLPACGTVEFVVLGIGINVNTTLSSFPPGLRNLVTSLYDVTLHQYDPEVLLRAVMHQLNLLVPELTTSSKRLLSEWQRRDILLGRQIQWQDTAGRIHPGRGLGIREDGCYVLQEPDGTQQAILAGDVSIGQV